MTTDLRIAFIGDSFINGTGDAEFLGWTGRVCARALARVPAVTHYNLGVRRDTSADVRERWRREADARLPAGVDGRLVFSFGVNDTVVEGGRRRIALADSQAHFTAIIAAARASRPVLVVGPPPLAEDGSDGQNRRIAELSALFARSASALGVPYLDISTPLSASALWREQVASGDGAHPGASGYTLLAELVSSWAAWQAWLGASPAQPS